MNKNLLATVVISIIQWHISLPEEHCRRGDDSCEETDHVGIPRNERRILLIGKTGVGKSSTGNTILGKKWFDSAISAESITTKTKLGQAERFGKKLIVVDTPGLFDTNKDNEHTIMEIAKCYGITTPGLHAIILVVEINRFTKEENETVEFFLERFGTDVINFLIIAFTHKRKLQEDGITIHDYVRTLGAGTSLKKLLNKINNRFVVFGYKGDVNERDDEVRSLLTLIDEMIDDNGGKFYTNEMYEEAEQLFRQRWEEEKRKEKEKHDKEIEDALNEIKAKHANEQIAMMEKYQEKQRKHQEYLERREREWQEQMLHFREKMRRQTEEGKGNFFERLIGGVVRFVRKLLPF